MKKFVAGALLCLPLLSHADTFAMNFDRISLVNFAQATYRVMLKRDYILSPELLAMEKPISLHVRNIDGASLPKLIERVLNDQNVKTTLKNGVYFLSLNSHQGEGAARGGQPFNLSGDVSSLSSSDDDRRDPRRDHGVTALPGAVMGSQLVRKDYEVYTPVARTGQFICEFVVAMFDPGACHVSGPVVVLKLDTQDMEKLHPLLEKIDTVAGRVKINATFVEVTSTGRDGFGMSVLANVLGSQLGVTLGTPSSAAAISLKGANFSAVIDAIKHDSRFKQIAAPSGTVYSGERFSITTGEDVPTLGDIQLDNKGNTSQAVVYRPSGVILDVVPRVVRGPGGSRVEAVIKAQVSSFVATTNGVNGSPTLSKREVQTVQLLDDGEIVVLGGLNSSKTTHTKATLFGFPFGHGDQSDSTELMLILAASVDR